MDDRTLRILEFGRIRSALAEQTTFSGGRRLAEDLIPSTNPLWVKEMQQETSAAHRLLSTGLEPPFGGLHDIRPDLKQARIGSALEPDQLLNVAETAAGSEKLAAFIREHTTTDSVLYDIAADIVRQPALQKEINRCISPDGQVKDSATPELSRLRQTIRGLQNRMRQKVESLLRETGARGHLQEDFVTMRGGRYVLPVKQEHRHAVPGLVHDQSASGATAFVEPLALVEMTNELQLAQRAEEEEVARILASLTGTVAAVADELEQTVRAAARLDVVFAKARLSLRWDCVAPVIAENRGLHIEKGRHPLLPAETVVPITVWLGEDQWALVITGPNTGGKTVTLKTVGLFVLMAQSGLHVPAASGTHLPLCDGVYADIGDEQSIEQSLSTFSSHMTHIVDILGRAGDRSLVLLDELGAGTDPVEGAALAMALLDHFVERRVLTLATTHYSQLREYAYSAPGLQNASVEFDVNTLQPTYRLCIGVAGSSNAFAISTRLGVPDHIIAQAKQRVSQEELQVEHMLQQVTADRRIAEEAKVEAEALRAELKREKAQLDAAKEAFAERRAEMLAEAKEEAVALLRDVRLQTEQLIGELRQKGQAADVEEARAARGLIHETEQQLSKEAHASVKRKQTAAPDAITPGAVVRLKHLAAPGEVVSPPDEKGQFVAMFGTMRATVAVNDVVSVSAASDGTARSSVSSRKRHAMGGAALRQKAAHISNEIDLRGMTAAEAIPAIEKYLDDALLAGVASVRLIHGKGTGALRLAVQSFLDELPSVRDYRLGETGEGGSGVTVVEL